MWNLTCFKRMLKASLYSFCFLTTSVLFGQTVQTYTVSTLTDNVLSPPTNSLRYIINLINSCNSGCPNEYVIKFSVSGTITLADHLPVLYNNNSNKLTVDGTSAPGYNFVTNEPSVTIYGASPIWFGMQVHRNGVTIKGLKFQNLESGILFYVNNGLLKNNTVVGRIGPQTTGGLNLTGCNYVDVLENKIESSYIGIRINSAGQTPSEHMLVKHNIVKNCTGGVFLHTGFATPYVKYVFITENKITDNNYSIAINFNNISKPAPVITGHSFANNILSCNGTAHAIGDRVEIFTTRAKGTKIQNELFHYLGYATADASKNWTFSIATSNIPYGVMPNPFDGVVATATDVNNNTSDPSAWRQHSSVLICSANPDARITTNSTCDSTTLCAPEGATVYQWEQDQVVINGSAAQQRCYTIPIGQENHNYRVKITQATGCTYYYSESFYVY